MDQGTLLVNGSLTTSINGNGTLGGTGTITGEVGITTVQPGTGSPVLGTFTVNGNVDDYGNLAVDLNGVGAGHYSQLDVTSNVTLGAGART